MRIDLGSGTASDTPSTVGSDVSTLSIRVDSSVDTLGTGAVRSENVSSVDCLPDRLVAGSSALSAMMLDNSVVFVEL